MAIDASVGARRLLVVANEACAGDALFAEIRKRTGEGAEVLVLAPALTPRLQFWLNDEALGRHAAEELLARSFAACAHEGLDVKGEVGDPDPLQAIDDALRTFDPDAIVIVTHPVGRQNWLERDVVGDGRIGSTSDGRRPAELQRLEADEAALGALTAGTSREACDGLPIARAASSRPGSAALVVPTRRLRPATSWRQARGRRPGSPC